MEMLNFDFKIKFFKFFFSSLNKFVCYGNLNSDFKIFLKFS